jgi:predicted ArsR family transcriptional regulator
VHEEAAAGQRHDRAPEQQPANRRLLPPEPGELQVQPALEQDHRDGDVQRGREPGAERLRVDPAEAVRPERNASQQQQHDPGQPHVPRDGLCEHTRREGQREHEVGVRVLHRRGAYPGPADCQTLRWRGGIPGRRRGVAHISKALRCQTSRVAYSAPMKPEADPRARARDRVLVQLKTRGAADAADLAERLAVTPMAIRQHLAALEREGLVAHREERRPVGRPARIWSLTPRAAERFPDTHADLTVELIGAVRDVFGEEGLDRLIQARAAQQRESYRAKLPAEDAPIADRVAALAKLRRAEGYMADWSRAPDGSFLLVENHCPICAAATLCQGFCRDELELFGEVLGENVRVEREEHMLAEARRCAYRVTPIA